MNIEDFNDKIKRIRTFLHLYGRNFYHKNQTVTFFLHKV